MPDEKAPSSGAFLPASLMYFCSGQPMHFGSGVDMKVIAAQVEAAAVLDMCAGKGQRALAVR
jgi:hypothetical protein